MSSTGFRYVKYKRFTDSDYELSAKIVFPPKKCADRSRKGADEEHTIHSACVSVQRAHHALFDLLRSNTWQYFITLTFASSEREDDQYCRDQFSAWRKEVRRKFPSMYYVAVPEYHEKGSIHYHVVVGGVSASDLGFVDSGRVLHYGKAWLAEDFISHGFEVNVENGEGAPIYNVSAWEYGFSTATEIRSSAAVALYVSKYLTKSNIDPRFFNKRRYYASHNCHRPEVVTDVTKFELRCFDDLDEIADLEFYNPKFFYGKYTSAEEVIKARLRGDIPIPKRLVPFDVD